MSTGNEYTSDVPGTDLSQRSAGDNIRELTEAGRQLFEAGQHLMRNLNELQQRVEHGTDLKAQLTQRPWLIALIALVGGIAGWRFFSGRHTRASI